MPTLTYAAPSRPSFKKERMKSVPALPVTINNIVIVMSIPQKYSDAAFFSYNALYFLNRG